MENENVNENKITNEEEAETNEIVTDAKEQNESEAAVDMDATQDLVSYEKDDKESSGRIIFANILDQVLIVAGSALLLLICDLVLKLFGYMFVRDNGALILAGSIIYFIINCIYVPILEKSKLKGTIAKRILNMN
ncbi:MULTISPECIES: RDD family protein [unclassified Clostridium]|uniref:RDD family protein n=1 Tax=unclassified Clostridium TaxID=2614128 RepID=UPI00029752D9|nr:MULTISPECIES: RDD family protein [unclassified Clostridium]EKQ55131.1 MAG: hypothetical protein A370_02905 [Clostridium sp. Maddingley MBC34-26]